MFQPPALQKTIVMKQVKLKIGCLIFPRVLQNQYQEKTKQIDARSTLVQFADKMSASEQEKLNALLARAMYACGTPFCMVENSRWQAFFKAIKPAYVVPSRYEVSEP